MHSDSLHLMLILLAILLKGSHSFSDQDNDVIESSGQTMASVETVADDAAKPLPEFMTGLFRCWNKRGNNERYKECLESMGEGKSAALIMNSNTVTAFIGEFPANYQETKSPKHTTISFNISSIKSNDIVDYSELRVFRKGMTLESIHSNRNSICDLNSGVNLTLLGEVSSGQLHVIGQHFINRRMLRRDEWMVFSNINSLLSDWIKHDNTHHEYSDVRRIDLVLQGGCASIPPEIIGVQEIPNRFPLLALFLQSSSSSTETQKMIESTNSSRNKRQISTKKNEVNHSCKLKSFKVNFTDLGWDKFIIAPRSYSARMCSGSCVYPLSSTQNGTLHSQIQAFYHLKTPQKIPPPCCTPTKLTSLSVIMNLDTRTIQIKVFPNMVATECGCR